ncbi:unnamed protein product [Ambrosiozyma monospora]|uniref:Unnamed protein product n=1 Tax=Ambrosiozyma monospora TaxID=43982 RepID=A0ACB5TCS3_AMBMO|nr:unnamed protein product [Ambrosiozyma monospora]
MSSEIPSNITIPPPEVRETIEKTAGYVNRNGASFEQRIKQSGSGKDQFLFINEGDPYNGYYRWYLKNLKEGIVRSTNLAKGSTSSSADSGNKVDIEQQIKKPTELTYLTDSLPKIAQLDLEMIKMAAQCVAINGEKYLISLMKHIRLNPKQSVQFAFLTDEKHSMRPIFNYYLKTYKEILSNKQKIIAELKLPFKKSDLLDSCFNRAEYIHTQETDSTKKANEEEKKRLEFASIDWQDFVVVETIEFTPLDAIADLSLPLIKADLEVRSLAQKRASSLLEEAPPDYDPFEPILKSRAAKDIEVEYDDDEDDDMVPTYDSTSTSPSSKNTDPATLTAQG